MDFGLRWFQAVLAGLGFGFKVVSSCFKVWILVLSSFKVLTGFWVSGGFKQF